MAVEMVSITTEANRLLLMRQNKHHAVFKLKAVFKGRCKRERVVHRFSYCLRSKLDVLTFAILHIFKNRILSFRVKFSPSNLPLQLCCVECNAASSRELAKVPINRVATGARVARILKVGAANLQELLWRTRTDIA